MCRSMCLYSHVSVNLHVQSICITIGKIIVVAKLVSGCLFDQGQEREAVRSGKQPYYLKASERKKQALVQRYSQLKESGQLEKVMAKRRKKLASKDHRLVPRGRRAHPSR